jgi:hypothetical protein
MNKETEKLFEEIVAMHSEIIAYHEARISELEDTVKFYGSSINNLEMIVKNLSERFYGTQKPEPYTITFSQEAYAQMLEDLNRPSKFSKALNDLFGKKAPWDN